jgi:hypothetical protein
MTARERIEGLTNGWYGLAVFGAIMSIVQNGIGFFSILGATVSAVFSIFVAWFLGRRLLAKSSFWRALLLIVSAISTLLATIATAKLGWAFLHEWSFGILVNATLGGASAYMNGRSLRVLTHPTVKAYFA